MPNLLAFTSGLDSTYCLHTLASGVTDVAPCFLALQSGQDSAIVESVLGTLSILTAIKNDPWKAENLHEIWYDSNSNSFVPAIRHNGTTVKEEHQGLCLMQQVGVMDTLRHIFTDNYSLGNIVSGYTASDCIEENFMVGEKTREEYLALFKSTENLMALSQRFKWNPKVLSPAFNKTKLEMWGEIPDYAKRFISVGNTYELTGYISERGTYIIRLNNYSCNKWNKYRRMGIDIPLAWELNPHPIFRTIAEYIPVSFCTTMESFFKWVGSVERRGGRNVLKIKTLLEQLKDNDFVVTPYYAKDVNNLPAMPSRVLEDLKSGLKEYRASREIGEIFKEPLTTKNADHEAYSSLYKGLSEQFNRWNQVFDFYIKVITKGTVLYDDPVFHYLRTAKGDIETVLKESKSHSEELEILKSYYKWFVTYIIPELNRALLKVVQYTTDANNESVDVFHTGFAYRQYVINDGLISDGKPQ